MAPRPSRSKEPLEHRKRFIIDAEVDTPDEGPCSHPLLTKSPLGEGFETTLSEIARRLVLVRVPQERSHVELGLPEHRFRVDGNVAIAGIEDVVVVEVTMDEDGTTDRE